MLEETLCKLCALPFSEACPPRLLTMCGHTFCQNCIRDMICQKNDRKFRFTCPIDDLSTDLPSHNPSLFPKNISLLNMIRKKDPSHSHHGRHHSELPLSFSIGAYQQDNILLLESDPLIPDKEQEKEQVGVNCCEVHQKPLDLVCTRDFHKVCSSCVIFGDHRGHNVRGVNEVQDIVQQLKEALKLVLQQSRECFDRLESKNITYSTEEMLTNKKQELKKQINVHFQKLREQINEAQMRSIAKLNQKIDQYRQILAKQLKMKKQLRQQYKQWQATLEGKIRNLDEESYEEKLKTAFKRDNFLQVSLRNLEHFKLLASQYLNISAKFVKNLRLVCDEEDKARLLRSYCKFQGDQISESLFFNLHQSCISKVNDCTEQILLEEECDQNDVAVTLQQSYQTSPSKASFYSNAQNKKKDNVQEFSNTTQPFTNGFNKLNRLKSMDKSRFMKDLQSRIHSPNPRKSDLKQTRTMSGQRASFEIMIKKHLIPDKIRLKLKSIINGMSDTLDLTSGELFNEKVVDIVEYLKDFPVVTVKLVRNNLTDEGFIKCLPHLNSATTLNVSRNGLTQKSLLQIIKLKKEGGLNNLKSLMIGQNKITEKKNKNALETLRGMGVSISN